MNSKSSDVTPEPAPEPAVAPTPGPTAEPTPTKAGKGIRAAAVLIALVLAFLAAVAVVASVGIADLTPCDEVTSSAQLNAQGECYDGSNGNQID